ncbi:hypothetical protein B566_EDAN015408 [Ephemera danica]|nr:hypothetical protein B566_EDAN015408 [Ephemera danica]
MESEVAREESKEVGINKVKHEYASEACEAYIPRIVKTEKCEADLIVNSSGEVAYTTECSNNSGIKAESLHAESASRSKKESYPEGKKIKKDGKNKSPTNQRDKQHKNIGLLVVNEHDVSLPSSSKSVLIVKQSEKPEGIIEKDPNFLEKFNYDGIEVGDKEQLQAILLEYEDIFMKDDGPLGLPGKTKHINADAISRRPIVEGQDPLPSDTTVAPVPICQQWFGTAIPDVTAETCARALVHQVILKFGCCEQLISDLAPSFLSSLMTSASLYMRVTLFLDSRIPRPTTMGVSWLSPLESTMKLPPMLPLLILVPPHLVGVSKKLQPRWLGPFRILDQTGPSTFKIKEIYGKQKSQLVNADRLKPYYDMPEFASHMTPLTPEDSTSRELVDSEEPELCSEDESSANPARMMNQIHTAIDQNESSRSSVTDSAAEIDKIPIPFKPPRLNPGEAQDNVDNNPEPLFSSPSHNSTSSSDTETHPNNTRSKGPASPHRFACLVLTPQTVQSLEVCLLRTYASNCPVSRATDDQLDELKNQLETRSQTDADMMHLVDNQVSLINATDAFRKSTQELSIIDVSDAVDTSMAADPSEPRLEISIEAIEPMDTSFNLSVEPDTSRLMSLSEGSDPTSMADTDVLSEDTDIPLSEDCDTFTLSCAC